MNDIIPQKYKPMFDGIPEFNTTYMDSINGMSCQLLIHKTNAFIEIVPHMSENIKYGIWSTVAYECELIFRCTNNND